MHCHQGMNVLRNELLMHVGSDYSTVSLIYLE